MTERDVRAQLHYLASALKAPRIAMHFERLAEMALTEHWSHEDYLAAVLEREVKQEYPRALNCAFELPISQGERVSTSSTSPLRAPHDQSLPHLRRDISWTRPPTSCSWDHQVSAKPILQSP